MSDWQTSIAIYAAIVATGAFFLEVRRWVEGRARVLVTASSGMMLVGRDVLNDDQRYLLVKAVNRGSLPTTVTHMALLEYKSFWHRWRDKSSRSALITHPQLAGQASTLPGDLPPGGEWSGIGNQDEEIDEWIATGKLFAGVYCTHRDRPIISRLRKAKVTVSTA